jgi:hypothetical protein
MRPTRLYAIVAALLLLLLLFLPGPVNAAAVAIVRPASPTPELAETLFRIHGELLSVGIEVEFAQRPVGRDLATNDARGWLEKLVTERGVDAVIDSVGDVAPIAVDVWLVDKTTRRLAVLRVELELNAPNPAERLAIRAIEVLRSSFLEVDLAARERRRERPTERPNERAGEALAKPSAMASPLDDVNKPASHPERFGVEVGAAGMTSLDGVGPAILPILRFDWAARPWLLVQATLAGQGTRPNIATTAGNAQVAQDYGVVGGSYRFRTNQGLQPFLALSAGVLRTSVEGQSNAPYKGHAIGQWSCLLDGSVGARFRLGRTYDVALAAHVQAAAPYVAIHFADAVVATSGRPNILLTFAVGAWL